MTTRPLIPNDQARNLFLARHGLADDPRPQQSPSDLLALIERIGFVQLDSINTVARAHDMILFARNQTYRPAHLRRLIERDRSLFENWTHDASIIPTRFFPYWQPRFRRDAAKIRERWTEWRREGFMEMLDQIRAHVAEAGTLMSRNVGDGEARGSGGWWDWHPSKTALEYLWRTGELAICHRQGFQKAYALTEQVIPAPQRAHDPDDDSLIDWACNSALDRLGFATSGEIAAFWDSISPAEAAAWCRANPDLIEVEVETANGSKPRRSYARPDVVEQSATAPAPPDRVRVLSPFDPALRDRKRALRLFNFDYKIEVFVPALKRQYGYYVFPVMEGPRLIGRIDMKCDRAAGSLDVTGFWPERGIRVAKGRLAKLEAELERQRRFTGADEVTFSDAWLRLAG